MPSSKPRRAVLYLRVSDQRQVDNYSLETQEKACREHCQRNGWKVAAVFREEGESAKTTDRPQLREMLRGYTAQGGTDPVVMFHAESFDPGEYLAQYDNLLPFAVELLGTAASRNSVAGK